MNLSILPSLSQVRSAKTPRRVGLLVEAVDGHDREELLDRPVVGRRLEDGEVAVVGVGQPLLQRLQLVGHVGELAHDAQDLLAAVPEQALDARPGAQVEVAEGEEVDASSLSCRLSW